MEDLKEQETYGSYGLVQMNRINGQFSGLFGTNVDSSSAVALCIKRAIVNRGLNKDWIGGGEEIIEVILSPNQFSELLTTMNCGVGVPCTIQHVAGKRAGMTFEIKHNLFSGEYKPISIEDLVHMFGKWFIEERLYKLSIGEIIKTDFRYIRRIK